jgi:predicted membrane protein
MAFSVLFVLFWIMFAVVFLFIMGSMVFHVFTVGSIFTIAKQRMKQHVEQSSPKPCGFCGSTVPAEETKCPSCGGPRDA